MQIHDDVWNNIVTYMDTPTLIVFFQVSKTSYKLSNTSVHWKERIENQFPKSQFSFKTVQNKIDYIEIYKELST
jgi:hypothetical protein